MNADRTETGIPDHLLERARDAISRHCGGENVPTTLDEVDEVIAIAAEHRRAEAKFRELAERYHCGVPYWADLHVRGTFDIDGNINEGRF